MSVPPPPQHPPPRRQPPVPEDQSLTTQIFVDRAQAASERASADAGDGSGAGRTERNPPGEAADTQALSPTDVAAARRRAAEAEGESTRMMSMEELRQLAASSRIESLDGPRDEHGPASPAPRAGAGDAARAREAAPPGVCSAQSPPSMPPTAPPPRPVHAEPVHQGYAAPGAYPHAAGPPAPSAPSSAPPPTVGPVPGAEGAVPQRRRRRMPLLAVLFVVLSGVVVLGIGGWIVVDALTRDGGQSQEQAAPPPPATDDSTGEGGLVDESGEETEPPAAADTESFTTPSGNIGCTIDEERARCVVESFDYSPPEAPDDCSMAEWGGIVVANHEGAGFSCTPADFPAEAEQLDYGQTLSAHGMTCSSEETGVTCRSDETGAAFSVARADASFDQAG